MTASGTAALGDVSGLVDVEAVVAGWHAVHGAGDAEVAVILAGEGNAAGDTFAVETDDGLFHILEIEEQGLISKFNDDFLIIHHNFISLLVTC